MVEAGQGQYADGRHRPWKIRPGYRAGILPLDQIIKIDGKSTAKMELGRRRETLARRTGHPVTITIRRPSTGQTKDYKLVRAIIKMPTVKDINDKQDFPLGDNGIGYVRINQFGEKTADDLAAALKKLTAQGMKALILDLRDNPGGLLEQAEHVCEKFLPDGQLIVSTEGRSPAAKSEYRADRPWQAHRSAHGGPGQR